jgi:hypothetical protein
MNLQDFFSADVDRNLTSFLRPASSPLPRVLVGCESEHVIGRIDISSALSDDWTVLANLSGNVLTPAAGYLVLHPLSIEQRCMTNTRRLTSPVEFIIGPGCTQGLSAFFALTPRIGPYEHIIDHTSGAQDCAQGIGSEQMPSSASRHTGSHESLGLSPHDIPPVMNTG